jgi:hypothetical protein
VCVCVQLQKRRELEERTEQLRSCIDSCADECGKQIGYKCFGKLYTFFQQRHAREKRNEQLACDSDMEVNRYVTNLIDFRDLDVIARIDELLHWEAELDAASEKLQTIH